MQNNNILKSLAIGLCTTMSIFPTVARSNRETKKPNVLFILADDHARTAISAYNGINAKLAPTPNIDAIGKNGAVMRNMLCTNSISGPSRACLLTGKYSTSHGFYQNEGGIVFDGSQMQYQKVLHDNGYTTALSSRRLKALTITRFTLIRRSRVLTGILFTALTAKRSARKDMQPDSLLTMLCNGSIRSATPTSLSA